MEHIAAHSIQVCRVAVFLTDRLNFQGETRSSRLNRDLIRASALLHDITKTRSFKTRENHAKTGAQMIHTLGYPEVASIIGQHVRLDAYCHSGPVMEAEVVNYADKRVAHDRIVSLEDRMVDIQQRYAGTLTDQERICSYWKQLARLENKLFARLPFLPLDLEHCLDPQGCTRELSAYQSLLPGR